MPLRLKSLELHGYKTFAGRTVFEFAEGITAIVGPNGSGKSNIADALRWVLGEQSYSLLRAKKTEDMIFSGSEQRPRSGMASTTLAFDNSDNWLPVDYSEVALMRRAYRDGRNEYLLNGQHVRLREINELLAQSGLSERTFTILGQGLVDASLALKADERRRLFEEAAGIGLYRIRREETLRRLETTRRNLERVLDIMLELESRLRSLERQARRAQDYAQAQADLRFLLRDWYGYHWHQAQKALAKSREIMRDHEVRLNESRDTYQKHQHEYSAFREKTQELRSCLNTWHHQSSELHSQREKVNRDLAVMEERQRSLSSTRLVVQTELGHILDEERLAQQRFVEAEQEVSRLQADYEEAFFQVNNTRQIFEVRQADRDKVEKKSQVAHQKIDGLNTSRAELRAHLDELQIRLENLQKKLQISEQHIKLAEQAVVDAEKDHKASILNLEKVKATQHHTEADLNQKKTTTIDLESALGKKIQERSALETRQTRLEVQLEVVEQAEQSLTGYAEGARFLLEAAREARIKGSHGALSAVIDVPVEFETAIAAALGDYVDAILLKSDQEIEEALKLLESGKAGRAALIPLSWLFKQSPMKVLEDTDCVGLAADLVKTSDEFRSVVDLLLGHVIVVKDRRAARRLVNGEDTRLQAVTLRGEVFRADGAVIAGQQTRSVIISRPRQRRELRKLLDDLSEQITNLSETIKQYSENFAKAKRGQIRVEGSLRRTRSHFEEAQETEQRSRFRLESACRECDWQRSQKTHLEDEIIQAESEYKQSIETLSVVDMNLTQAYEEIHTLDIELAELAFEDVQNQLTYWNTRLGVVERVLSDAKSRCEERRQTIIRLKEQQDNLGRQLNEIDHSLAELELQREDLRNQVVNLNEQLEALRLKIEPYEKELETIEGQEINQQDRELSLQRVLSTIERQYSQAQLDSTHRQESLDILRQRIEDDFGLVMFEYDDDVSGPVPLPFEGMVEQLPVVATLPLDMEEQVTQQRARLRRMGPVNPEAKKEYDTEHERYEFLKKQVSDLQNAENNLHQVIAELDELTKREFLKTFDAVANEFHEIFIRLFNGGSAKLVLTDAENPIDTGIDIEARLPGRREQGLALLSGGERSLIAIALVFSLLKVSPTPICVMDEVDAMLDEANISRFSDLLLDLSKDTQFVIVTHNRNTVQVADVIYGVTMGRDSTSQVISLKLDEITEKILKG